MTYKEEVKRENRMECVKLGIVIVDEKGHILRGNQLAKEFLNLDQIKGRVMANIIPNLTVENMHRMMIQNTCNTFEMNGRSIQLQVQQIPLRHDHVEILLIMIDVSPMEHFGLEHDDLKRKPIKRHETLEKNLFDIEDELMDIREAVSLIEIRLIQKAYSKYGNVRDAAKALGIDASTFVRKRNKYEKLGMIEGYSK